MLEPMNDAIWWKEAIVYQIYPRSFKDSNNDGIGDLNGITSKIEYLKDLGVDVIWLSPHFDSPNIDNGYDISDYQQILKEFGTMQDFDNMLAAIHKNGMKLIIDLVINHSSDEHRWFKEAKQSKDNEFHEYYIWKSEIPNDWISFFSGTAWAKNGATDEYYLHLFAKKQPDLNWENPKLRQDIYEMMKFWLDKGVNGFRMDVISLISKDPDFKNFPKDRFGDLSYYANGPKVHTYLQEMNHEVLSKYDCMTVGEAFGVSANEADLYVGKDRNELNMIYHFDHAVPRDEHCFVNPKPEFSLVELKEIFNKWDKALNGKGWNTVYFGNHDNPRMVSRFGDIENYHQESAKMLATLLLTLPGTPFLYQGDEIGMTNNKFNSIDEFDDLQVLNAYEVLVNQQKHSATDFMNASNKIARDHARTPMQWNAENNAGFSDSVKPWLKINENYKNINVENQQANEDSILNFYKKLIQIRKQNAALIYGEYIDLEPLNNEIWAFTRALGSQKNLILVNFTGKEQSYKSEFKNLKLLVANQESDTQDFTLKPYEARIYAMVD